ncbi:MAG: PfkB family carbohydrate kinase [Spirochaetota bacterium]
MRTRVAEKVEDTMPDVICMGELLAEFVATTENVSLADAPGFIKAPGGAPANVAVAVQRLGLTAGFIGKVGDDPFGRFLTDALEREGVDTSGTAVDANARTTTVFVAVWDDGHKDLCFYRNPGADMLLETSELDPGSLRSARAFHYGSIGLIDEPIASAQRTAVQIAREAGALISYDPNYRPTLWPSEARAREIIQSAYAGCHLAKVSEEELDVATGHGDPDVAMNALLESGVELVVISRGAHGAPASNGTYRLEVPSPRVEVVETTGAGDGFVAALMVKLLPWRERLGSLASIEQDVVRDALEYAACVGALTCTKPGAIPALPTAAEVDQFRRQGSGGSPRS